MLEGKVEKYEAKHDALQKEVGRIQSKDAHLMYKVNKIESKRDTFE
jgi:hypothetical protein